MIGSVECSSQATLRRLQVALHLVQVAEEVVAIGAAHDLGRLVDAHEHLVEGRLHRGKVRVEAHAADSYY